MDSQNDDDFILPRSTVKKEDNYPAWMKELTNKADEFVQRFQRVEQDKKTLIEGLNKFDQTQADHEKHMRRMRIEKKREKEEYERKIEEGKKCYQQTFLQQANQRNQSKQFVKLNIYLILNIIKFSNDPIITTMKLRRVCQTFYLKLRDDFLWEMLCEAYLGEKYVELNRGFKLENDYWRRTAYYFRKGQLDMDMFFYRYAKTNCPKDIKVKSIVNDCIGSLQFMQKVYCLSYNEDSDLVKEHFNKAHKYDYSLNQLQQSSHYGIQEEAKHLYITLMRHHNYQGSRILPSDDKCFLTKQIINQYISQNLQLHIPSLHRYCWVTDNEKQSGWIRDFQVDKQKAFDILSIQVQDVIIFYYKRFAHENENPMQEYLGTMFLNKQTIEIKAYNSSATAHVKGQLNFLYKNASLKKPDKNERGIECWGKGTFKFTLNSRDDRTFNVFLCLGTGIGKKLPIEEIPLIIGNCDDKFILVVKSLR